jgi:STE24 endopeptidase
MNLYGWIIITTLCSEYLLNLISDLLNITTLGSSLPEEFREIFDEELYRKSQAYARAREYFGMISSAFSLALTCCFWFLGGFDFLDGIVRTWNFNVLTTGVLYVGILVLLRGLISLPFSIYSTFVIEERFGFNRTTWRTFITDLFKGLMLGILPGGPLVVVVLALFQYGGSMAWFWCWMVATAFILAVQFVAPAWIMPLFNKFTPLTDGDLRSSILTYAKSVNFSLKDVYVMDGSKRSGKSNAFFTGFGKNKRIALFDTLIERHTVPELVGVLAHEIGHYKKHHIVQGMITGILHTGLLLFCLSLFVDNRGLTQAFFLREHSVYGALVLFGLLYTPVDFFISLALQAVSRRHEFAADRYAAETTGQPAAMADALKKLSVDNLSHLTPHPFYVTLNYSHPPVLARIRALQNLH